MPSSLDLAGRLSAVVVLQQEILAVATDPDKVTQRVVSRVPELTNGDGARDIPDNTERYPDWVWQYYVATGDRKGALDDFNALAADSPADAPWQPLVRQRADQPVCRSRLGDGLSALPSG